MLPACTSGLDLASHHIWGWGCLVSQTPNIICVQAVETAAPTGQGLAELEEAILLQAELMDLKAMQGGPAEGTTVEARQAKGQGPVATVIVKRGALRVGIHRAHLQRPWDDEPSLQTVCMRL